MVALQKTILLRERSLLFVLFCLAASFASAQYSDPVRDSVYVSESRFGRFISSKTFRTLAVGVPLIAEGFAIQDQDSRFRHLRNTYLPQFKNTADNYLQYAPMAVMLGLKAAGVESRDSWGRMIVSSAFAHGLMTGTTSAMKYSWKIMRPDGSSRNSFPSGHTATAFMSATLLTREYGHKSPFIGIGAYSVATATGLMRMANNRHWLSDVLTGAGVGVITTNVAYLLADLVFKDRGLLVQPSPDEPISASDCPSFFALYVAINAPISNYDIDDDNAFETSSGSTSGLEGAYFFSPYIGVGAHLTVTNTRVIVNSTEAESNMLYSRQAAAGLYLSYPIIPRFLIGGKLTVGATHYPSFTILGNRVPSSSGASYNAGVNLTFRTTSHYSLRLFTDYNLLPPHSAGSAEHISMLSIGSSFAINF